jgi:hypothetical protein
MQRLRIFKAKGIIYFESYLSLERSEDIALVALTAQNPKGLEANSKVAIEMVLEWRRFVAIL